MTSTLCRYEIVFPIFSYTFSPAFNRTLVERVAGIGTAQRRSNARIGRASAPGHVNLGSPQTRGDGRVVCAKRSAIRRDNYDAPSDRIEPVRQLGVGIRELAPHLPDERGLRVYASLRREARRLVESERPRCCQEHLERGCEQEDRPNHRIMVVCITWWGPMKHHRLNLSQIDQ